MSACRLAGTDGLLTASSLAAWWHLGCRRILYLGSLPGISGGFSGSITVMRYMLRLDPSPSPPRYALALRSSP